MVFGRSLTFKSISITIRMNCRISSICCASSTVFAYLGEFHDTRNRARVLMISINHTDIERKPQIIHESSSFSINFIFVCQLSVSYNRDPHLEPRMELLH